MTALVLFCVVQLLSSASLMEDLDSRDVEQCETEPEHKLEPTAEVNSVDHDSAFAAVEV